MNAKLSNSKHKEQSSDLVHMWLYSHYAQENNNYSENIKKKTLSDSFSEVVHTARKVSFIIT